MLVDANILLYAVDEDSPFHPAARRWVEEALNGPRRVGLPWMSVTAFVRIASHPRAMRAPLAPAEAWELVDDWLGAPAAWIPAPGRGFHDIFRRLTVDLDLRANLVSDAAVAALGLEHGLTVVSADSDFARFPSLTWFNPVAPRG